MDFYSVQWSYESLRRDAYNLIKPHQHHGKSVPCVMDYPKKGQLHKEKKIRHDDRRVMKTLTTVSNLPPAVIGLLSLSTFVHKALKFDTSTLRAVNTLHCRTRIFQFAKRVNSLDFLFVYQKSFPFKIKSIKKFLLSMQNNQFDTTGDFQNSSGFMPPILQCLPLLNIARKVTPIVTYKQRELM